MMPRSGSACVRRRAHAVPRARRGAAFWGRTSMRMRCAWPLPTASRPASPIGCTWRSARSARSRAQGRDGADRRQSALRRTHRRGIGAARPVFGARQRAARSIPRLAGRDSHRQSAAGAEIWASTPSAPIAFFNGTIECRLLRFDLNEASEQRPAEAVRADWSSRPGAQMFANRLRKNLQRLDPWAEQRAHRLLPRVRRRHAGIRIRHRSLRPRSAARLRAGIRRAQSPSIRRARGSAAARRLAVLPEVLAVPLSQVHSRVRKPQKGSEQYEKRDSQAERHAVQEGGLKFWVNFRDYLDTGLFLDHRIVRGHVARLGEGRGFPESVLLHRQRHGLCGGGRRAQHRQRRSVEHLSGLGARESAAQRLRRPESRVAIVRIACSGSRSRSLGVRASI